MPYSQTVTLTDDGSFDRPINWNDADNVIEVWGAGGTAGIVTDYDGDDGTAGVPGAGGDYASITNIILPPAVNYNAGQPVQPVGQAPGRGEDSYVSNPNEGVFVLARGGNSLTPSSIGAVTFAGGQATTNASWGGGGAAGPHGDGGQKGSPTTKGGTGDNGSGGLGGVENANGVSNANGGGGSGRGTEDDATAIRVGGFPGGGTGMWIGDPDHEFAGSVAGAGQVRISWNPA